MSALAQIVSGIGTLGAANAQAQMAESAARQAEQEAAVEESALPHVHVEEPEQRTEREAIEAAAQPAARDARLPAPRDRSTRASGT